MNDEQAEKENASSSIQQAPRSMGVNAPFKRPTLAFKPPLINQPRTTPKDTQMLHASKAAAPSSSAISVAPPTHQTGQRYRVVFLTFENFAKKKKIRKWQDGVLELSDTHIAVLWNEEGKKVWQGKAKQVGGKGCNKKDASAFVAKVSSRQGGATKSNDNEEDEEEGGTITFELGSIIAEAEEKVVGEAEFHSAISGSKSLVSAPAPPLSLQLQAKVKQPLAPISHNPGPSRALKPLHDPSTPGAIILSSSGVPVVIDPHIGRKLRPHQIEGVTFMFSKPGVILADEMGLGKTLQVIALIWTLLKQGPSGQPALAKCIVVCPSSLVANWAKEVRKWLGNERLQALTIYQGNKDNDQIFRDFKTIRNNPSKFGLMVLSYESARKYAPDIGSEACDLLVCDEAHRLKSGEGKTIEALNLLNAKRRVLLSGTPVQNNLVEFNALLEFVSPGLLGSSSSFKKLYSDVIAKGRDASASEKEKADADARSLEFQTIIATIVLRRTSDILIRHLPPLTQLVVFVRPSKLQIDLYRKKLEESERGLALIKQLQKISTSPMLLDDSAGNLSLKESSSKMQLISIVLKQIIGSGEKCVLVSTSTATLDLADRTVCGPMGIATVRIDGSTNVNARQDIVDGFNKQKGGEEGGLPGTTHSVMLLSTRAGGAGLNLIGANNLILIDSDWNPAHDLQAMARIWRDGQTKPCFVFRLLTAGTIEEKVFQRQIKKGDLANATLDLKAGAVGLHHEDLVELFSIQPSSDDNANESDTMALLDRAQCEGSDAPIKWRSIGHSIHSGLSKAVESGLVCAIGEVAKGGEKVALNDTLEDDGMQEEFEEVLEERLQLHGKATETARMPSLADPGDPPLAVTGSRKRLRKLLEDIENQPDDLLNDLEDCVA